MNRRDELENAGFAVPIRTNRALELDEQMLACTEDWMRDAFRAKYAEAGLAFPTKAEMLKRACEKSMYFHHLSKVDQEARRPGVEISGGILKDAIGEFWFGTEDEALIGPFKTTEAVERANRAYAAHMMTSLF